MAVNDNEFQSEIWSGKFPAGGIEIEVAVLSDGTRIIKDESLRRMFAYNEAGGGMTAEESAEIMRFCRGHGLPEGVIA